MSKTRLEILKEVKDDLEKSIVQCEVDIRFFGREIAVAREGEQGAIQNQVDMSKKKIKTYGRLIETVEDEIKDEEEKR